ncbi:MAG: hypothetical protein QY320_13855 [Gammaproteobacteria bacterium]|nr:MAG: hypothetical protein QY320_13855 [Gammaproteobacteria bacterium]
MNQKMASALICGNVVDHRFRCVTKGVDPDARLLGSAWGWAESSTRRREKN